MSYNIDKSAALIVVDPQNDFFEGGALSVSGSNDIIPVLSEYIMKFRRKKTPIFFTRDWHPANHISFKAQGGPWPQHCVQDTPGARFHPSFIAPPVDCIISKGMYADKDAYSAFEDTQLHVILKNIGVLRICVGGLATDYCVKQTVLDGLKLNYEVLFLEDAAAGVNLRKWDSRNAICDMVAAGAKKTVIGDFR